MKKYKGIDVNKCLKDLFYYTGKVLQKDHTKFDYIMMLYTIRTLNNILEEEE